MNRLRHLLALLSPLFLLACNARLPAVVPMAQPQSVDNRPAIIFIHGFYGSALRERSSGHRFFYTAGEILFGHTALSLFSQQLNAPPAPELEVEGLLSTVPVIPALYAVDVYGDFLHRLEEAFPGHQVLPLVYDWRDDLSKPVAQLQELVNALHAKGAPSVKIVAHSMGGRVAAYYLAYGNAPPERAVLNWSGAANVNKVAFFGTPFRGSMISLRCFEKGSGLPGADHLLPAETMGSFPALYELMPPGDSIVLSLAGQRQNVDLLDPALWWNKHFGLFRRMDLPKEVVAARRAFVFAQLLRARIWDNLLAFRNGPKPPASLQILDVVGVHKQTLDGAYFDAPTGHLLFDPADLDAAGLPKEPVFADGDETVTSVSARLPELLAGSGRIVFTESPHTKLFLDDKVEAEYKKFLAD
jgi:pimeloyl-ACP methyl ester carboxylesterase